MIRRGFRDPHFRFDEARAIELLRAGVGSDAASFRSGQLEAIRRVTGPGGRTLLVQRTGWGKSAVYFIATKLLRESGKGPALLVSPLLALMRDQIASANRFGVNAETINSSNNERWSEITERIRDDSVDLLLVSPERLANKRFQSDVLAEIGGRVSLLIIDEAHCISDWGHDFRPEYQLIARLIAAFPPNLPVIGTTATANDRVVEDLDAALGPDLVTFRGSLHRPTLHLQTIRMHSKAMRMAWIAQQLDRVGGSGIIYALTIRDANRLAEWLKQRGHNVAAYTGGLDPDERLKLEGQLTRNEVKALVATTALGMGFDKPDLRFVFHFQTPQSVVLYYQQVGRAGRAVESAYGVLLGGSEDLEIQNYFIESAFPSRSDVDEILKVLEEGQQVTEPGLFPFGIHDDGLTISEIEASANVSRNRIKQTLEIMNLESPAPVVRDGNHWRRTVSPLGESFWNRISRITALRRSEQEQMQEYLDLNEDHMNFLMAALDGGRSMPSNQLLPDLDTVVDPAISQSAIRFLGRSRSEIQPRKQWPNLMGLGKLARNLQFEEGRALSIWGDPGVAEIVQREKYEVGEFSDRLVRASMELIQEWRPLPSPVWLTCIPSPRRPKLVPDFARCLAKSLGIQFVPVFSRDRTVPEQKTMANSAHQVENLRNSLSIDGSKVLPDALLLVDDIVDSRWTLTVAANLLRSSGSGEVFPFVLADAAVR